MVKLTRRLARRPGNPLTLTLTRRYSRPRPLGACPRHTLSAGRALRARLHTLVSRTHTHLHYTLGTRRPVAGQGRPRQARSGPRCCCTLLGRARAAPRCCCTPLLHAALHVSDVGRGVAASRGLAARTQARRRADVAPPLVALPRPGAALVAHPLGDSAPRSLTGVVQAPSPLAVPSHSRAHSLHSATRDSPLGSTVR